MTESEPQPAESEPESPEPTPAAAKKLSTRTIVIAVAIALVVLTGGGVGIYFMTKGDDTPAAASGLGPSVGGPTSETPPSGASSGATPTPSTPPSTGAAPPEEVGNAKVTAEKAIEAINSHNVDAMKKISCDPEAIGPADTAPPDARAELLSVPELTGDSATVELKLTIGDQSTTIPLPLRKQNGIWCVD